MVAYDMKLAGESSNRWTTSTEVESPTDGIFGPKDGCMEGYSLSLTKCQRRSALKPGDWLLGLGKVCIGRENSTV